MEKYIEDIKMDQSEIKNAISEKNNTLEGIKNRLNKAKDWISDLEDRKKTGKAAKGKKIKDWGELKKYFGPHEA